MSFEDAIKNSKTPVTKLVSFRIDISTICKLDILAEYNEVSRNKVVMAFIEQGLKDEKIKKIIKENWGN